MRPDPATSGWAAPGQQPPGQWPAPVAQASTSPHGQPGPYGQPPLQGYAPPAPKPASTAAVARIDPVPGTEFGVAYAPVPPTVSGVAIGSLVAGIGSIAIATVVGCFGLVGASDGWGPIVAGAFAVLAGFLGLAGLGLAVVAMRQIRASAGRITGRGLAIAGMSCGGAGVLLTAGAMLLSVLVLAA
jgi:hypothetical protein